MRFSLVLLIACSILLASIAQIVLRAGMSHPLVQIAMQSQNTITIVKTVSTSFRVLSGLALYFASAVVWLLVLAKIEVSVAYPFIGFGLIVTMLLARWVHGEPFSTTKVIGTLLIALGVAVITQR